MKERLAAAVVRGWPLVLVVWVLGGAALVIAAPPFSEVAAFDEAAYLPPDSPAQRGQERLVESWPQDNMARTVTTVLARSDRPLDAADEDAVRAVVRWLEEAGAAFGGVQSPLDDDLVAGSLRSDDGQAALVVARLEATPYSAEGTDALQRLRAFVVDLDAPAGLARHVTGSPAVAIDEHEAVTATVERTRAVSVALVVVLLLFILRSPVAALVPLATVSVAYVVSLATVSLIASVGLEVSHLFESFAIVIIFGAGTDYSLLLMTRFREEMARSDGSPAPAGQRRHQLTATLAVLVAALGSAAASTMVGFSAQSVAEFGLFRTMGPALAIAVGVTLLAGLTLSPALMALAGRWLFWPRRSGADLSATPGGGES